MKISLRAARINKELTQKEVAEKMNVSTITIIRWEQGKTAPDVFQFEQLCKIYGVSTDDIFLDKKYA